MSERERQEEEPPPKAAKKTKVATRTKEKKLSKTLDALNSRLLKSVEKFKVALSEMIR